MNLRDKEKRKTQGVKARIQDSCYKVKKSEKQNYKYLSLRNKSLTRILHATI